MNSRFNDLRFRGLAALLALGSAACSSNNDSTAQPGDASVTRSRNPTHDSIFTPVDLEDSITKLFAEIEKVPAKSMSFGVILKAENEYWTPVKVGALRAFAELQLTGEVWGSSASDPDVADQEQLATFVAQRDAATRNGFVMAPRSSRLEPAIDVAVDQGMPVVTIDNDAPVSKRQLYVGTLNRNAGKTGAETILSYLTNRTGTVVILGSQDSTWIGGLERTAGAKETLEAAGYSTIVRSTNWSLDTGEADDVAALKEIFATATPPVVGCLGLFNVSYRCAKAVEAMGKTGDDIISVAFDLDLFTAEYMESGRIKATHTQRQYYMGYLSPYVLYGFNVLGVERTKEILAPQMVDEIQLNTGLDVVAADKLDEYHTFQNELGM